jgi:curli biogenesis system outer membrane secretion channel CsgG
MKVHRQLTALAVFIVAFVLSGCAGMQDRLNSATSGSAQEQREQKQAALPHCAKSLGTIAIVEPKNNWWQAMQLDSPQTLLKFYIQKSGCFTLVNRGRAFELAQEERQRAGEGNLQKGSNIGKGQVKAVDYLITPDVVSRNNNAGGNAVGAVAGGILGAFVPFGGLIAGQISLSDKTADVTLSVTAVRSGEEAAMVQGNARKTDLSFGGAGLGIGMSGLAGAGASSYANTELGQVVALAYLDAYTKLIPQLGGLPENAASSAVAATK